jgi:hypothetical protein
VQKNRSNQRSPVVFIQLPQVDNDVHGTVENPHLAARYLIEAARRFGQGPAFRFIDLPESWETRADPDLAREILRRKPFLLIVTLYLWNIERSLDLCRRLRRDRPGLHIAVGGPEVAPDHPFLFRRAPFDIAAVGEGEWVFPRLLNTFQGGPLPDSRNLFVHRSGRWRAGRAPAPEPDLRQILPPPRHPFWRPDANGMAYLEISRGCPLRCAYCRYPHLRRRMTFLPAADIFDRIDLLSRRGTREIRFIDPTFNAHPEFRNIIQTLADRRTPASPIFFSELKADTITAEDARLLAQAGFREIEVGLQSRNPAVLRRVRRPTRLPALDAGVRHLLHQGIRVTLDVMYGLPGQPPADVLRCLRMALRQRRINVQCLQTLLLPGTEIRTRRAEWKLVADDRPPYGIQSTPELSAQDLRNIETFLAETPRLRSDCPTTRWLGRSLPDLFPEQQIFSTTRIHPDQPAQPRSLRCAVFLQGTDLFASRMTLARWIAGCIKNHPHTLWQFILEPRHEEPLDLLETLTAVLVGAPSHLLDRYASVAAFQRRAARRLFIRLPAQRPFARDWVMACEDYLQKFFF